MVQWGDLDDDDGNGCVNNCLQLNSLSQYLNFFKDNDNNSFKLFHSNIRSLSKNFDDILIYLESFPRLDVIVLTECWLSGGEEGAHLDGYDCYTTDKQRNRNDGVIVYVNKLLSATATQVSLGDVYGIGLDFEFDNKTFNLLAIYRTFDSTTDTFLTELENYYDTLDKNKMCIFTGDININLLHTTLMTDMYLTCLLGSGLIQCVDKPTRVTENSVSCLDHIFVRYSDMSCVRAAVLQTSTTDHYSTGLTITATATTTTTDTTTDGTPHTYIDRQLLADTFATCDWEPVLSSHDVNSCSSEFDNIIRTTTEKCTKNIKSKTTRFHKIKPWITLDLVRLIRTRDKLSKTLVKQPFNQRIRTQYRDLRQTLSNSLKKAKRDYYRNKINQSGRNPKIFWGVVNELMGRLKKNDSFPVDRFLPGVSPLSNEIYKQIANDFNSFFAAVGQTLAEAIDAGGEPLVNDNHYRHYSDFTLRPVTECEVVRYVSGLRGGSAPGFDGVSASTLKQHAHIFSKPLLHLINLSINSGCFPNNFKLAKVFPLYKSNDITDKNNFRPISLLSVFSKVLEKIVKDQLVFYLDSHEILTDRQYGFRKDKNISDALFDITKEINIAINKDDRTMLIFLDLKKAFDSVNRHKLLTKLEAIGIRGTALAWFRSYLTGRLQSVSICGVNSEALPVDYGVVQGSTLGPILFLIYINNISKLQLNGQLFLFADDALIFLKGKAWDNVTYNALQDLKLLKKWFDQNILSLNITKTKFMPISLRFNTDYPLDKLIVHSSSCNSVINGTCACKTIEKVLTYKYLGVIFDYRMKWTDHIQALTTKLRKFIFAFRQINEILLEQEIKQAYFAYIQSLVSFGIIAWGGALKTHIEPLNIIQKRILKVGFKKDKRYPTDALFRETAVYTVRQLFIKAVLIHTYKHFPDIISVTTHTHNTRYSRNVGLTIAHISKSFSYTNSFYIAQLLYRNIRNFFPNSHLFDSHSLSIFKNKVTKWLFELDIDKAETIITADYGRA